MKDLYEQPDLEIAGSNRSAVVLDAATYLDAGLDAAPALQALFRSVTS